MLFKNQSINQVLFFIPYNFLIHKIEKSTYWKESILIAKETMEDY